MRRCLLAVVILGFMALVQPANAAEPRVALVIGNSAYAVAAIDGDTIKIDGTSNRLNGINAPGGPQTWLHVKSGVRLTIVVVVRTLDKIGNIMAAQI